jgi:hypothetical protein
VLAGDVVDLLLQLEVLELEPLQLGSLRLQVLRQAGALLPNNPLSKKLLYHECASGIWIRNMDWNPNPGIKNAF